MRAVRLTQVGKPLEEAEVDLPEIGASDVLIQVAACGICHSDEHYRAGISRIYGLPLTLGHEIAGWSKKSAVISNMSHAAIAYAYIIWHTAEVVTSAFAGWNSFVVPEK